MNKTMAEIRDAEVEKFYKDSGWVPSEWAVMNFKAGFDCAYNESEKLTRVMSEEITQLKAKLLKFEGMTFSDNEALKLAVEALECANIELLTVDDHANYGKMERYYTEDRRHKLNKAIYSIQKALAEIRKIQGME